MEMARGSGFGKEELERIAAERQAAEEIAEKIGESTETKPESMPGRPSRGLPPKQEVINGQREKIPGQPEKSQEEELAEITLDSALDILRRFIASNGKGNKGK